MNKLIKYSFLIVLFAVACKQEVPVEITDEVVVEEQDAIISSIGEQLTPQAKQKLLQWKDFQEVNSTMNRYAAITVGEALVNAKELSELIKKVADTIRIDLLDKPDLKIRFNVLYNHSLRLEDMSSIQSITDAEVKDEVVRLLEAYSSVNDKINAIYKIEAADKEFGVKKPVKKEVEEKKKSTAPKKIKRKKVGIGTAK